MNWTEIAQKYPKGYNKLSDDYLGVFGPDDIFPYEDFYLRDLYDFFDAQGIIPYLEFNVEEQLWFYWVVLKYPDGHYSGGGAGGWKPEERKKAEEAAFLKAFEIIEEQL